MKSAIRIFYVFGMIPVSLVGAIIALLIKGFMRGYREMMQVLSRYY